MINNNGALTNHQLGAFYTPEILSTYVANKLITYYTADFGDELDLMSIKVLDPACGDGALLKAFEKALYSKLSTTNLSENNTKVISNVFGIDINEKACLESEENLKNVLIEGRHQKYLVHDALTLMNEEMKIKSKLPKLVEDFLQSKDGVDCIITNPPWGAELNQNSKQLKELGYHLATGQFDSYEIMIELSLSLLRKDGFMALILPDSIFLSEHRDFREFLLKNSTIKLICRLGEGFFAKVFRSTVILIIQKRVAISSDRVLCFTLNKDNRKRILSEKKTLLDVEKENAHLIKQSRFLNDKEFRFDIDISDTQIELQLLNKIERYESCWDYFDSGRGIEISKQGQLQICESCLSNYPKAKSETSVCKVCGEMDSLILQKIIEPKNVGNWDLVLAGEDINRYLLKKSKYINPNVSNFNYKESVLKTKNPKLLIRKTGLGISASIDYENSYTLQTVFHFIAKKDNPDYINVEYLLGVLNSRVILYYHLKKSGETEWKSHPYVTQKLIKELPIPSIKESIEEIKIAKAISENVKKLLKPETSIEQKIDLDLIIESYVIKLFGINEEEYKLIEETINSAEQLKSISALKIPDGRRINFSI